MHNIEIAYDNNIVNVVYNDNGHSCDYESAGATSELNVPDGSVVITSVSGT